MPPGPDCIKTLRQQCNDTAHNTGYTFCYKNLAITIFPCITLTGACLCLVFYCSLKIDKNCRRACPSNFSGRLTISNIKNHKKTQPNIPKANPRVSFRRCFLYFGRIDPHLLKLQLFQIAVIFVNYSSM